MREIEREEARPGAFIITLTGVASATVQHEAFASGVDLFLTKPFGVKKLQELIDTHAALKKSGSCM